MVDVIVAGGGPSGMMLAAELTLAGVDVVVAERRATRELVGSRAGGFHSRTIELLDQRGIADRFLAAGTTHQGSAMGSAMFDVSDFPTRHPYTLGLWQNHIERLLAEWLDELGVRVERGREVVDLAQDDDGVEVRYADGETARAAYLVGADGGRSTVRRLTGIDFPGEAATRTALIAEVEVAEEPPAGVRIDAAGVHGLNLMDDGRTYRVVSAELDLGGPEEPTLADLSAALNRVFGTDFGVHSPTWISRFSDATRQAASYREGRVLLIGDAAHIHYPAGGQGIGLGVQDAVNLGWKLAQVISGVSDPSLLDSYQAERHPVVARVLRQTMVMGLLQRPDARNGAVKELLDDLMEIPDARRRVAGILSGLDVRYDLGGIEQAHPLLGRRVPDLDVAVEESTGAGATRVFALLHDAGWVLLDLGGAGRLDLGPWSTYVHRVVARCIAEWALPVVGAVTAPGAVLIRPDGHVAWVGDASDAGLADALATWIAPLND